MTEVSSVTRHLIDTLSARDNAGRQKYGTTLDRGDLLPGEWAQHMLEELLDAAGYLVALQRQIVELQAERDRLAARVAELEGRS